MRHDLNERSTENPIWYDHFVKVSGPLGDPKYRVPSRHYEFDPEEMRIRDEDNEN